MRARLVVFPVRGRNWCFGRCTDHNAPGLESAASNRTLKELWKKIDLSGRSMSQNAETVVDYVADKMNRGWSNLEKAPKGTMKNKMHGWGLRLLSRVRPSEIFLKSISKEIRKVEITYPLSLNPRLVRRRLRHIALRGSVVHKQYFYGSLSLLPFTSALSVLPLPNIPFFWILFRAYSHWQALKGSERLLILVSDCSKSWQSLSLANGEGKDLVDDHSEGELKKPPSCPWVLVPSKKLEELLRSGPEKSDALSNSVVSNISEAYGLDQKQVLKYRDSR